MSHTSKVVNRPSHPCQNPHCGNTLFRQDYDYVGEGEKREFVPIWQCTNCSWQQPRKLKSNPTSQRRAFQAWSEIREEWKTIDEALLLATDAGQPSGCIYVHSSSFNSAMNKLMEGKLKRSEVAAYRGYARRDMETAKIFVQRYAKVAYA